MSESTDLPPDAGHDAPQPAVNKRLSPAVAGGIFVLLLMAGFAISNWTSRSGPQLTWVYDLDQAVQAAGKSGRRIFLYVHEKDCPVTRELDRNAFSQRYAREILAQMVPCRVELAAADPLRARFGFIKDPVWVVLDSTGEPVQPKHVGGFDELQFTTYVRPR